MKNIHILPTDKPSRLFKDDFGKLIYSINIDQEQNHFEPQHIYITSDEEIKEGDYWIYICPINGLDYGDNNNPIVKNNLPNSWFAKLHDRLNYKKIILTTDQLLDGVQTIDNTFLEWFVKNPSCEEVEVGYGWIRLTETDNEGYWVSIPNKQFEMQQEEPKQETLEESFSRYENEKYHSPTQGSIPDLESAKFGAKWQQERSENDMIEFLDWSKSTNQEKSEYELKCLLSGTAIDSKVLFSIWFEQFKKKV